MSHENPHHDQRWKILAILGIAQLMVVLDATIVNVALPSAQRELHFTDENRQWIITAYSLAFGSMLLLGGKIGDIFGRKRTFVFGLAGFALASAAGGAAQSFEMLVAARGLQGAFGALLAPAALSLVTSSFTDPSERNKAFGIFGAITGSGASIGLLLGGVLTQTVGWRSVMYVNLVFAIIAVSGALVLLHNQMPAVKPRLDIPGVLTVSAGLFALVFGFSNAEMTSWTDPVTVAMLAAGVVLLGIFVWLESRVAHPLLPLRVLSDRNRAASFLSIGMAAAAMFGVFLFLTYYLQQNLRYTEIATGVAFLPMTLVLMVTSVVVTNRLSQRFGPGTLVATGMVLGAVAMLYLTRIGATATYATEILPSLVVMGISLGLVFSTAMNVGTLGVKTEDVSVASATVNASQQVGGSLGISLLSTVASAAAVGSTTVHGYTTAFAWSASIFFVGAAVAAGLYRRGVPAVEPSAEPVLAH